MLPLRSIDELWRVARTAERYGAQIVRTAVGLIEQGVPVVRAAARDLLELEPPRAEIVTPRARLDVLLAKSVGQSSNGSRQELHDSLLRQLVPDEARILAALSDGGAAAVVHVTSRSLVGTDSPLLANASTVGRAAGVALVEKVPVYVTHLLGLGLAELQPEDDALENQYELLMAETTVRDALADAGDRGLLPPRVTRQTLQLSALGRELWAACRDVG